MAASGAAQRKTTSPGAQFLSDPELVALFLDTGSRGRTAVDLARDLLGEFGGLGQPLSASLQQLCEINGFGPAKASQLLAIIRIGKAAGAREFGAGLGIG